MPKKSDTVKDIHSLGDMMFDDHNANKGTAQGKKMVGESIGEYGAGRSIVADKNGKVIGGNKTLQAAIDAGMDVEVIRSSGEKLIVHQRADLDLDEGDKARLLAYADNRSSEVGLDWDVDVLSGDIAAGIDLSGMFDDKTLEGLGVDMGEPEEPPEAQMDAAEALQEKWQVKDGDVWQIGEHRLMCGDNTDAENLSTVMDGQEASIVLTDPPYNVADDVAGSITMGASKSLDKLSEAEWDRGFSPVVFLDVIRPHLTKDRWIYCFCSNMLFGEYTDNFKSAEDFTGFGCWCKPNPMPSLAKNNWTLAIELVAFAKSGRPVFNYPDGEHCLNWWNFVKKSDGTHPTQKPTEIMLHILSHCSTSGDIVTDPFLGSGTTMVAAEQLGRKCYGMEIEPKYCAVILERMSDMGLTPELVENARG